MTFVTSAPFERPLDVGRGEHERDRVIHVLHARPRHERAAHLDLGIKRLAGVDTGGSSTRSGRRSRAAGRESTGVSNICESFVPGNAVTRTSLRDEELRRDERGRLREHRGHGRAGWRHDRPERGDRAGRSHSWHGEDPTARLRGRIADRERSEQDRREDDRHRDHQDRAPQAKNSDAHRNPPDPSETALGLFSVAQASRLCDFRHRRDACATKLTPV